MNLSEIIFVLIFSALFALLEIQIEGPNGWAANLPTWKVKNPFKKIINWPIIDGYHLWMIIFIIFSLHMPYFFGFPFNRSNEFLTIEAILLFIMLEDFLWFVLNPAWGVKKFFTKDIPWHSHKIFYLPQNYWVSFVILGVFELLKHLFA